MSVRALLLAACGAAAVVSALTPQAYGNKYYEFVNEGKTFADAVADAESRTYKGRPGRLAIANTGSAWCRWIMELRTASGSWTGFAIGWVGLEMNHATAMASWRGGKKIHDFSKGIHGKMDGYAWIDPYRTKWAGLESCIADPVCATKGWYLASQGINLGATSLILPYIVEYDGDDDCTGVTCAAGHYCYDDADTHYCCAIGRYGVNCASAHNHHHYCKAAAGFGRSVVSETVLNETHTKHQEECLVDTETGMTFLQTGGGWTDGSSGGGYICDKRTNEMTYTDRIQCDAIRVNGLPYTYLADAKHAKRTFDDALAAAPSLTYEGRSGYLLSDIDSQLEQDTAYKLAQNVQSYVWLHVIDSTRWGHTNRTFREGGAFLLENYTADNNDATRPHGGAGFGRNLQGSFTDFFLGHPPAYPGPNEPNRHSPVRMMNVKQHWPLYAIVGSWASAKSTDVAQLIVKIPDADRCAGVTCPANQHCENGKEQHWCCPAHLTGEGCVIVKGCNDQFYDYNYGEGRLTKHVSADQTEVTLEYTCYTGPPDYRKRLPENTWISLGSMNRTCDLATGQLLGPRPRCGYNYSGSFFSLYPGYDFIPEQANLQARSLFLNGVRGRMGVMRSTSQHAAHFATGRVQEGHYLMTSLQFPRNTYRGINCSIYHITPDPSDPLNLDKDFKELYWETPMLNSDRNIENDRAALVDSKRALSGSLSNSVYHHFRGGSACAGVPRWGQTVAFTKTQMSIPTVYGGGPKKQMLIEFVTPDDCKGRQCGEGEHCIDGIDESYCCPLHLWGTDCGTRIGCTEGYTPMGQTKPEPEGDPLDVDNYFMKYACADGWHLLWGDLRRKCGQDGRLQGRRPHCGRELRGNLYEYVDGVFLTFEEAKIAAGQRMVEGVRGKLVDISFPQEADLVYNMALTQGGSPIRAWIGIDKGVRISSADEPEDQVRLLDADGNPAPGVYSKYSNLDNALTHPSCMKAGVASGWLNGPQAYNQCGEKLNYIVEYQGNSCSQHCCPSDKVCISGVRDYACCAPGYTGMDCAEREGCVFPSNPPNGAAVVSGSGDTITAAITCNSGYVLVGGQATRPCLTDGSWGGGEVICAKQAPFTDARTGANHLYYLSPYAMGFEAARRACDSLQTPTGWHGLLASPTTAVETEFVHAVGGGNKDLLTSLRCNNTAHPGCWSYSAGPSKGSPPNDLDDVKMGKLNTLGGKAAFGGDYLVVSKATSAPNDIYSKGVRGDVPRRFVCEIAPVAPWPDTPATALTAASPTIVVQGRPTAVTFTGSVEKGDSLYLSTNCLKAEAMVAEYAYLKPGAHTYRYLLFKEAASNPTVSFTVLPTEREAKYKVCLRRGGMYAWANAVEQVGVELSVTFALCLASDAFVFRTSSPVVNASLHATRGTPPYTFAIIGGDSVLPKGVTFDATTGALAGQVSDASIRYTMAKHPTSIDVVVTDASGRKSARAYNVSVIDDVLPFASLSGPPSGITLYDPFTVRVEFSEEMTDFEADDIIVDNGVVQALDELEKRWDRHLFSAVIAPNGRSSAGEVYTVAISLQPARRGVFPTRDRAGNPLATPLPAPLAISFCNPTPSPTLNPTVNPTVNPSTNPTTRNPTQNGDTFAPTVNPTLAPTANPTTGNPTTLQPTGNPTTATPTKNPTVPPTPLPLPPTMPPTHKVPKGRVKALLSLGVNYYTISDPASFAQQVLAALFDVLADHETERLMDEDAIWAQEQLAPTTSPTPAPNVNDTANPTTFAPTSSPTYNHASAIQYIGVAPGRGDTVLSLYCLPPHADHTCALVETYTGTLASRFRGAVLHRYVEGFTKRTRVGYTEVRPDDETSARAQVDNKTDEGGANASLLIVPILIPLLLSAAAFACFKYRARRRKLVAASKAQAKKRYVLEDRVGPRKSTSGWGHTSGSRHTPVTGRSTARRSGRRGEGSPRHQPGRKAPMIPGSKPSVRPLTGSSARHLQRSARDSAHQSSRGGSTIQVTPRHTNAVKDDDIDLDVEVI